MSLGATFPGEGVGHCARGGAWRDRGGLVWSSDPLCTLGTEPAHRALEVLGVVAVSLLGDCRLKWFFSFLSGNVFF